MPAVTSIKISKDLIVSALKVEPLCAGEWVRYSGDDDSSHCTVCAVGAVVRTGLGLYESPATRIQDVACYITDFCSLEGDETDGQAAQKISEMLSKGEYMSALSAFFEREYFGRGTAASEELYWKHAFLEMYEPAKDEDGYTLNDDDGDPVYIIRSQFRDKLISFVENNFPEQIILEIPYHLLKDQA